MRLFLQMLAAVAIGSLLAVLMVVTGVWLLVVI